MASSLRAGSRGCNHACAVAPCLLAFQLLHPGCTCTHAGAVAVHSRARVCVRASARMHGAALHAGLAARTRAVINAWCARAHAPAAWHGRALPDGPGRPRLVTRSTAADVHAHGWCIGASAPTPRAVAAPAVLAAGWVAMCTCTCARPCGSRGSGLAWYEYSRSRTA